MLKVVGLEGGPCGGKTTAVEYIANSAHTLGIQTVVINEPATEQLTLLAQRGLDYSDIRDNPDEHLRFQTEILRTVHRGIRRCRHMQAAQQSDMLVLVDRPDIKAYVSDDLYQQAYTSLGYMAPPFYTQVETLLYFPTVAKQSVELYDRLASNNKYRYESAEQAIATCDANFEAIKGHPNVWILNEESFERSLRYAANIALRGFSASAPKALANN